MAALAAGERLEAAVIGMWRRRGWVVIATDAGLRMARRPWVLGRAQDHVFGWADLVDVASGPQRVTLRFAGDNDVSIAVAGPHGEFVALLEAARRHLGGEPRPAVAELRELAKLKLGRFMTFGFEAAIDGLPDRLEPGERVERLATATLDFQGLLVLTDRRLLLLDVTLRRERERLWSVPRTAIRGAERRDEFAAVLASREPA